MKDYPIIFEADAFRLRTLPELPANVEPAKFSDREIYSLTDAYNFALPFHFPIAGEADRRWKFFILEGKEGGSSNSINLDTLMEIYQVVDLRPSEVKGRENQLAWTLTDLKKATHHEIELAGQFRLTSFNTGGTGIKGYLPGGWIVKSVPIDYSRFAMEDAAVMSVTFGEEQLKLVLSKRCGYRLRKFSDREAVRAEVQRHLDAGINIRLKHALSITSINLISVM